MMKKKVKRILSCVLALMMTFTVMCVGGVEVKADEKTVVWKDAEMEDFWNGGVWSHNITDWSIGNLTTYEYSSNSKNVDISNFSSAETALNFYSTVDNNEIIISQTVDVLPAGTYTLTAPVMGDNTQVKMIYEANGVTTEINASQWLTGWNSWDNITGTFTTTQDLTNVKMGISMVCHNGGWGYLDSINLTSSDVTVLTTDPVAAPVYTVEATVDKTSIEQNGTVKLTAVVKKDGVVVSQDQLDDEDIQLWWWADKWKDGHTDGLVDAKFTNYDENSGYSLTAEATLPSVGTYYIMAELRETAPSDTESGAWVAETNVKIVTTSSGGSSNPDDGLDDTETEDTAVNIELVNADFTSPLDGTWTGAVNGEWGNGNSMDVVAYSSDAWLELPSYVGTTGLKFSMNHGETMTISQWVASLPAGTYTITAPVMGENTDVYLVLGDQEIKATSLSGYNDWSKAKATFTISEDMTDVKVGFKLVATSSGSDYSWGWIDSISLVKGVPATGDNNMTWLYVMILMAGVAVTCVGMKKKMAR